MTAGEKSNGSNGLNNFLFPMPYMYLSQGEHDTYYYAIDLIGWDSSGRVYQAPLYAPFDCVCVHVGTLASNTPTVTWQSTNQVNFIDGSVDYAVISLSHDDNFSSYTVGETRSQGDVFGHTGTTGISTGDHCHLIVGKGTYTGYSTISGHYTLNNQYHSYLAMGVNDTVLYQPLSYDWQEFSVTPTPPTPTKTKSIIPVSICNGFVGLGI